MGDRDKDKEQLQNELMELHKKIAQLEQVKASQEQTEKKLAKFEELYHLIAENSADVITLHDFNLRATYRYISPSGKDISGYEPEELLGKSPFEFLHPDDKKKLFSLLKDYINAKLKNLFTGKELPTTERLDFRFKDKEGNYRRFQSTGNIVGNQLLFITRDITKNKKTEEKLRQSEEKFSGIFKSIPDAAFYQATEGTILDINPAFTRLLGYTKEDILGKNIDGIGLYPKDKVEEGKDLTRKTLNEDLNNFETVRQKKDGTLVSVRISTSFVKIKDKITGIVALYQDITERKQNEKLQQVLYNISKATNSPISLEQLYPIIHKELGNIIDTTNFYIALLDEKKDNIFFPYHVDEKDDDFPILNFRTSNTLTT